MRKTAVEQFVATHYRDGIEGSRSRPLTFVNARILQYGNPSGTHCGIRHQRVVVSMHGRPTIRLVIGQCMFEIGKTPQRPTNA